MEELRFLIPTFTTPEWIGMALVATGYVLFIWRLGKGRLA